jgi:zinc transporter
MTAGKDSFEFALLLDGKGGARDLSEADVQNWSAADGILWIDSDQSQKPMRTWLAEHAAIGQSMLAILLAGETRPRSVAESDSLAIIMRGINMNPGAVPDDMVAVRVVLERNRIFTSHRRKLLSVRDLRESLLAGTGPKTVGEFVASLTRCLAVRIEAAVENIEGMIEKLDDQIGTGEIATVRGELSIVRRQAAAIRRHLAPQRDALDRLARSVTSIMTERELFAVREEGDHVMRYIEDLDLAREHALVAQDELTNRVAHEQNTRMYLLSVVAAIFLPLTFVTGLLGMNVAGLPGTASPYGFVVATIVMIALGFGLAFFFKRQKWL